jgi:hypothetical protein
MADVTDDDRGQLMLVFAMAIALVFVVLALLLNTAIYTENIATRKSDVVGAGDAEKYRAAAAENTGHLVRHANYHDNGSYVALHARVDDSVANWSDQATGLRLKGGRSTNVSLVSTNNGTRIVQREDRNFTNVAGDGNWTVVEDTGHVRSFRMNVTRAELVNSSVSDIGVEEPFRVNLSESSGSDALTVHVFKNLHGTDTINVAVVEQPTGTTLGSCSAATDRAVVDVSNATLDGEACPVLETLGTLDGALDITYNWTKTAHGEKVEGTYTMVVSKQSVAGSDYGAEGSADHPFLTKALYSATVEVSYRSSQVDYRIRLRVAPGETR